MFEDIKTIGIVGAGLIGRSWAAHFLAQGFDVRVSDPNADAEGVLREYVDGAWPALEQLGLKPGASRDRVMFSTDTATALQGVDFVQENGPEQVDIKRGIIAEISDAVGDDVLIATSSSGIVMDDICDASNNPARVILGHPFNPPHIIPLVEIVGSSDTPPEILESARRFYEFVGKKPIVLNKAVPGHVANRLQAAVMRECMYLVSEGVVSAEDVDSALCHGLGLRWAILGQLTNVALGGGSHGIEGIMDHLGPAMEGWLKDLGSFTEITPDLRKATIDSVNDMLKNVDMGALEEARNEVLLKILEAKKAESNLP